jgi:hypothetical protein
MNSSQEQIARLKRSNERLTILCLIFGAVAIAAGIYARIQWFIANENLQIANIQLKRAAEEKQKASLSMKEAVEQRKTADALAIELARLKAKPKNSK